MELTILPQPLSVCQISGLEGIDWSCEPCFVGKTEQELSLVCPTDRVPPGALAREDGWRGFRVEGVLSFTLVGILAEISFLLAEEGISIFALSTYNTDYILTKAEQFPAALRALEEAGYQIKERDGTVWTAAKIF